MTVRATTSDDGSNIIIAIEGNFDASYEDAFRVCYEENPEATNSSSYVIDMENTSYLDSSALGMLLVFRDFAGGDNSDIKITKCSKEVKKILTVSGFDSLFSLQ